MSALRPTALGFGGELCFLAPPPPPQDVKEASLIQGYGVPSSGVWKLGLVSSLWWPNDDELEKVNKCTPSFVTRKYTFN